VDLNRGLPPEVGSGYRAIVAGDVLEHVVDPEQLLADLRDRLSPDGELIVSVPNFGHWYPRGRTALGLFDYDQRGPLDQGHVRFFTRRSFEKLVARADLTITERSVVGAPVDVLDRGGPDNIVMMSLRRAAALDRAAARTWPTMFGYQLLYRLERA
jgi:SAM-dependent methyltransferase